MPEYKLRFEEADTGCTYCWDEVNKQWVKICPVSEFSLEIRLNRLFKANMTPEQEPTLVMPELIKWVRHEGRIYCWDRTAGKIVEIKMTDIPLEKISNGVLIAMMNSEAE